jgi:hypothetical protein
MLANITHLAHELSAKRRHFCTFSSFRDFSRLLATFGIFSLHFSSFRDSWRVFASFGVPLLGCGTARFFTDEQLNLSVPPYRFLRRFCQARL